MKIITKADNLAVFRQVTSTKHTLTFDNRSSAQVAADLAAINHPARQMRDQIFLNKRLVQNELNRRKRSK